MNKYDKIKFLISLCAFIFLMITPINAYASLGGYEAYDLYHCITNNVKDTNEILNNSMKFAQTSPFDLLGDSATAEVVATASKSLALVVATLFLCIDFFKKSVNFEWSRGWENIMLFAVKVIVIKVMVQNCDVIISDVYRAFNSINVKITGKSGFTFLPCGEVVTYTIHEPAKSSNLGGKLLSWAAYKLADIGIDYKYEVSKEAVLLLHPDAYFPEFEEYNSISKFVDEMASHSDTQQIPLITMLLDQAYFLLMKGIACLITVQIIGRAFELIVYTLLAPLPLATFASEGNCDIGKNFIKRYVACVLQITVIFAMFIAYTSIKSSETLPVSGFMGIVTFVALALGIMKSGTWARNICGIS